MNKILNEASQQKLNRITKLCKIKIKHHMKKFLIACGLQLMAYSCLLAQNTQNNPNSNHGNKFQQVGTILPTPNEYRNASGFPRPKYLQHRCDHHVIFQMDENKLEPNAV